MVAAVCAMVGGRFSHRSLQSPAEDLATREVDAVVAAVFYHPLRPLLHTPTMKKVNAMVAAVSYHSLWPLLHVPTMKKVDAMLAAVT